MEPTLTQERSRMLARGLRRRCPRCGEHAFLGYFEMKEDCDRCGLHFEREPGYWVGAVIINTAVIFSTFLVVFGGMVLATYPDVPWAIVFAVTVLANIAVPILFYPISRTLWAAMELSWHPLEQSEIDAAAQRIG